LEACGSAHHWGRALLALGHDVKLGSGPRKCTFAVHGLTCRMMMTRRQYMHTAPINPLKPGYLPEQECLVCGMRALLTMWGHRKRNTL
jgi:hypothetical protein